MKNTAEKTNAIRILERQGINFSTHAYAADAAMSGTEVAMAIGYSPDVVYKTLVTAGKSGANYVFVIPVGAELDLKKAAAAVGEKSIGMVKSRELFGLTGYVHGGCSPIGMKKPFVTAVDESALTLPSIVFSAGRIGLQIEMSVADLKGVVPFSTADLVCRDAENGA